MEYINSLNSRPCINLINLPTRIAENCRPSSLDHVYTNVVTPKISGGVCLVELSDHLLTFAIIEIVITSGKKIKYKKCMNFGLEEFLTDLDTKLSAINLDCPNNAANMAVKNLSKIKCKDEELEE